MDTGRILVARVKAPGQGRATRQTGRAPTSPEGIPLASSGYELSGLQLNEPSQERLRFVDFNSVAVPIYMVAVPIYNIFLSSPKCICSIRLLP